MSERTAASHDSMTNVKKFVLNADEVAIHGIVKYLGIALKNSPPTAVCRPLPNSAI
jgi:hypothetical protein